MADPGRGDGLAQSERSDVFVSYARGDAGFVQGVLAAQLLARGKDVWIDREDIPAAAEWEARVRLGIEASNAFLFVITPSSLRSEQCAKELRYAKELGKRLIPVVRRTVDDDQVPDELRRWNWIWLRDEDDLDAGIEHVVDALDSDLEWRDAHSRLNVRALEWDRAGRDSSLLLRGRDLSGAEAWHSQQGGRRETPTTLQSEYIVASRRAASRRQRQLLGSVVAALALVAGLAVFALIQRSQAIHQAHLSRSRELAVSAGSVLGADPELSLMLAREAARAAGTPEAEEALRTALAQSRVRLALHHSAPVTSAAFSPDGMRLITAGKDGTARIWSAKDGKLLVKLSQPARDVRWATFDPSGRRALVSSVEPDYESTGDVRVFDVSSARLLQRMRNTDAGYTAEFARDDQRIVTTGPLAPAIVWNLASLTPLQKLDARDGTVDAAALSPDGQRVALLLDSFHSDPATANSVEVRSVATGRTVTRLQGSDAIGISVRFSPNGRLVVTTGFDLFARVWDARTGLPVADLRGHAAHLTWADFSPDGRLVATAAEDGAARVFDARTGRLLLVLRGSSKPLAQVEFSPDSTRLVSAGEDDTARVWDLSGLPTAHVAAPSAYDAAISADSRRAVVAVGPAAELWDIPARRRIARLASPAGDVSDTVLSPDGSRILTAAYPEAVGRIWDARTGRLLAVLQGLASGGLDQASFSPDGGRVTATTGTGDAGVWDAATGRPLLRIPRPSGDAFTVAAFTPDGRRIVTGQLEAITLWDGTTGRRLALNPGESPGLATIEHLAFSPDGRLLLGVDDDKVVRILDARTLSQVSRLKGHTSLISRASFSPDSQLVLTASDDQTARIWRASSGDGLARLTGHGDDVTSASFSPNGRFVETTAGDNAARIWSAASGRRIATVTASRGAVYTAAFRRDSRSLVLLGPGLPPTTQPCELCGGLTELLRLADHRITRQFTSRERAIYLHES